MVSPPPPSPGSVRFRVIRNLRRHGPGAKFVWPVLTEICLSHACSCDELLSVTHSELELVTPRRTWRVVAPTQMEAMMWRQVLCGCAGLDVGWEEA
jgi:hypothetical protein